MSLKLLPSTKILYIVVKKDTQKFATAQDTNTFQIIENLQKVLGLDISYANKAPPIGEPKATLTPADAPAAINTLLFSSFYKNSKSNGKYGTITPAIPPICASGPSFPIHNLPFTANVTPMHLVNKVSIPINLG